MLYNIFKGLVILYFALFFVTCSIYYSQKIQFKMETKNRSKKERTVETDYLLIPRAADLFYRALAQNAASVLLSAGVISSFQAQMLMQDYVLTFFSVDFVTGDINVCFVARKDAEVKINYVLHVKKDKEERGGE